MRVPQQGVDRCWCGCKYWSDGSCLDCGECFKPAGLVFPEAESHGIYCPDCREAS